MEMLFLRQETVVTRPGWDAYFLRLAADVAARGDCTRAQVGAVITDAGHRIVSAGYNGAPAGQPGCLEGACPRGRHYSRGPGTCACGNPWPCPEYAEPGSGSYGDCIALHAEMNAIIYAGRDKCAGGTIYVTREPCHWCVKMIMAAAIVKVVIP